MNDDIAELLQPDEVELVCRKYMDVTGRPAEYEKYLFLLAHQGEPDLYEALLSPVNRNEQIRLREDFRKQYNADGYLDARLIPGDLQVCTQKLPRYTVIPEHAHAFVELAYVLHGECRHIVEGREFRQEAGSIAYLTCFARHQLIAVDDAVCFTIDVRREFFIDMNLPYIVSFITPVMFHCGSDSLITRLVLTLYAQQSDLPYRAELSQHLLHTLLLYIGQRYRPTMERMYFSPLLDQKIIPILDYITENYRTVTLKSTAAHFHYSEAHLCRMFHEKTGRTFSYNLREFKLEQAARLLRETDRKLDDICDDVGYSDVTQFIHSFKQKYQMTPGNYRKTIRRGSLP